jgi:enoyl-CoA hydratase/carnithine racemase
MMAELGDHVDTLEWYTAHPSSPIVALVVTGAGGTFCSGSDLSGAAELTASSDGAVSHSTDVNTEPGLPNHHAAHKLYHLTRAMPRAMVGHV